MERTIETSGGTMLGSRGSGRGIVPTEPSYTAPSRGVVGQAPELRTVSDRPSMMATRPREYTFDAAGVPPVSPVAPSILGGGTTPAGGSNEGSAPSSSLYGNSPFGTLADLYLRMFGPSQGYSGGQPSQVAAIPVSDGGGSNSALLLLLLAGAGFAIYWFYYR